jgi:sugar phosphate isomerase/epimerase
MRLGTAWYGFRAYSIQNYFETAAALHLPYVELPMYYQLLQEDPLHPRGFAFSSAETLEEIRRLAQAASVSMVSAVAENPLSPVAAHPGTYDSAQIAFGHAASRRAIDICSFLGVSVLRVSEPAVHDAITPHLEQVMHEHGKALRPLGDYAADRGVRLCVENYGLNAKHMVWILDGAHHENIGTLYDPCNYHRMGEDPLQALRLVSGKVFYCHLKDAFFEDPRDPDSLFAGSRWPPSVGVGEGEIDWPVLVPELASVYDGYACIEYEVASDVVRGTRVSRDTVSGLLGAVA